MSRPSPRTDTVRAQMRRQVRRDTAPELALRRELHRRGLRYRVHRRPVPELRREADVVFGPARVAVFVMGCFWHCCPVHFTWPKHNAAWWRQKLERNKARDEETKRILTAHGWTVVVVWEHEPVEQAAQRIEKLLRGG